MLKAFGLAGGRVTCLCEYQRMDTPPFWPYSGYGMMLLLLLAALTFQAPPAKTADFAKWWPQFQACVARGDAAAVAKGAAFPIHFELGPIRQIDSEADLKGRFAAFFPAEVKKIIATGKPQRLPKGEYMLLWHAHGDEYSMIFKSVGDGFVLDGLFEGPA